MWQRKQTIYLILVLLLMVSTILLNTNVTVSGIDVLNYICICVACFAAAAIILYKNRKRQQIMCNVSILFLLCWIGLFCYNFFYVDGKQPAQTPFFALTPIVAIVCLFMAKAGIRHDENLIRSMDRIR